MATAPPVTHTRLDPRPGGADPRSSSSRRRLAPQRAGPSADQLAAAVQRCVDDHAQALLAVLAAAGADWDATARERRLLATLVGAQQVSSQRMASR